MGDRSGGTGRGGGGGGGGGIAANAAGGAVRTINGQRLNTADVVNRAVSTGRDNLTEARAGLARIGNTNPSEQTVRDYARQARVMGNIAQITGITREAAAGQIGRWDFSSAQTILRGFESYLNRRITGQRSRWTARTGGRR